MDQPLSAGVLSAKDFMCLNFQFFFIKVLPAGSHVHCKPHTDHSYIYFLIRNIPSL